METKLSQMEALWNAGDYRGALKMAATWDRLGQHGIPIRRGWAAAQNPKFYRQLKQDPEHLYRTGIYALAERFGLKLPEGY